MSSYPSGVARDRWILERRPPRPPHDVWRSHGVIVEDERTENGSIALVATVFLTGRECPWRCVMCDLWRQTVTEDTPRGAIPAQVAAARETLAQRSDRVTRMKLYNAGSFFDPRAVPEDDYDSVAAHLTGLDYVIVESHPSLVGPRVDRWLDALERHGGAGRPRARLEVAIGLETANPVALERLHKRMSVETFSAAARWLAEREVALRAFLLISPPFVAPDAQDFWLAQSIDRAFACGASVVSLIPTRSGNGAMEALAADGHFRAPRLEDVERSLELAMACTNGRGRVFVDLWDLERFASCPDCFTDRHARLQAMNLTQRLVPAVTCSHCGGV